MKTPLFALNVLLATALGAAADSYTITLYPGQNLIANQLDHGANTLNEVLPNLPPGSYLSKWDASSRGYVMATFDPLLDGWDGGELTLAPGEGAFLFLPTSGPLNLTFTGTPRTHDRPLPLVTGYQIVSRQTPEIGTYESIVGFAPVEGATVYRWPQGGFQNPATATNWNTNIFANGAWSHEPAPEAEVGEAWFLYLPQVTAGPRPTGLKGIVRSTDPHGRGNGPLAGASVQLEGSGSVTTDGQGRFSFLDLNAGTFQMTVRKDGYYPIARDVTVVKGRISEEEFQTAPDRGPGEPSAFDYGYLDGKFFVEGMPGNVSFAVTVAWNGDPGSVVFKLAGQSFPATVTPQGSGLARATVSLPIPAVLAANAELTLEVANRAGLRQEYGLGAIFTRLPGLLPKWYGQAIGWGRAAKLFEYSKKSSWTVLDSRLPGGAYSLKATVGYDGKISFNPLSGAFRGSLGGKGELKQSLALEGVSLFGQAEVAARGNVDITLSLLKPPQVRPSWSVTAGGKIGLGVPVVLVVDVLFPPAAPAVNTLLRTPVVGEVVKGLQLRVYISAKGTLAGYYLPNKFGDCFLGADSLTTALELGLEAEAGYYLHGVEAKVFAKTSAKPTFEICPEWRFKELLLRASLGVSASWKIFKKTFEYPVEVRFRPGAGARFAPAAARQELGADTAWQPIDNDNLRWGALNRSPETRAARFVPAAGPGPGGNAGDQTLLENVSSLAAPSVAASPDETQILFALHDSAKPWHAATDIGTLRQAGGVGSIGRITDDLAADFSPRTLSVNPNLVLATWERLAGDLSGATDPAQIAPHQEIVAAWFDRGTGLWSEPLALTDNAVVDREPLPILVGSTPAILWIQNTADAGLGNAANGDRLVMAAWTPAGWSEPQTLWSGASGILGVACTSDTAGQSHLVFVVDEDGDLDTRTDRELYAVSTFGGVWQPARRLTQDATEDALPSLVAPDGVPMCVWKSGGALTFSRLSAWNPRPVFEQDTPANDAATLAAVTIPGGAALAYPVRLADGMDLVASFYDATLDRWSLPRQLTHDEQIESALSIAWQGDELLLSYLKTQIDRAEVDGETVTQPGRTDLALLRYRPGHDAAIASFSMDPLNPSPGSTATINALIENRGDLPLQNVQVVFYDGHPQAGGTLIGTAQTIVGPLLGGATQEVALTWTVPAAQRSHDVYVLVDPAGALDDRDPINNSSAVRTVLPDLAIETSSSTELSAASVALTARVANRGVIPSGPCEVVWRLGAPDGEEIARSSMESLAAGNSFDAAVVWDTSSRSFTDRFVSVYAVVDAAGVVEEFDEANNDSPQTVQATPAWVPRLVKIQPASAGRVKLTFEATTFEASAFAVQSADSLARPVQWSPEPAAEITALGAGVFEALVPLSGEHRFYRVWASQ